MKTKEVQYRVIRICKSGGLRVKTKEFIKKVEELGYDIEISREDMLIKYDRCILAMISRTSPYTMSTYTAFGVKHIDELLDLCVEYVKTPIEEREEEKKYYLRKFNKKFYENEYLNYNKYYKDWSLGDDIEDDQYQTKFTCSEIENIKKKFNTGLPEFARMVVEE